MSIFWLPLWRTLTISVCPYSAQHKSPCIIDVLLRQNLSHSLSRCAHMCMHAVVGMPCGGGIGMLAQPDKVGNSSWEHPSLVTAAAHSPRNWYHLRCPRSRVYSSSPATTVSIGLSIGLRRVHTATPVSPPWPHTLALRSQHSAHCPLTPRARNTLQQHALLHVLQRASRHLDLTLWACMRSTQHTTHLRHPLTPSASNTL